MSSGGVHLPQNEQKIGERHRQFLKALDKLGRDSCLGQVYVHRLGQEMGMNSVGFEDDRDELAKLARELEEAGYIRRSGGRYTFYKETARERRRTDSQEEAYGYFMLTEEGERLIEEG